MAERIDKPRASMSQASATDDGAEDISVLYPDQEITIAGRQLTVREYGFVEGLKLRATTQPLLDDLYAVLQARGEIAVEHILAILAEHIDATLTLMAASANVERDWIEGLNQTDGQALMMTWWGVNGPFYVRAVVSRAQADAVSRAAHRAGATSSQRSSQGDTETSTPSAE